MSLFETLGRTPSLVEITMEKISCEMTAINLNRMLVHMSVFHYVLVIINLFREMFDSTLGTIGVFMRFFEVVCIGGYLFGLIYALQNVSVSQYWKFL